MQDESTPLRAALIGVLAEEEGSLEFDDLITRLPGCTWNQLCSLVDQLSRIGTLSVYRPTRTSFVVSGCGQPRRAHRAAAGNHLDRWAMPAKRICIFKAWNDRTGELRVEKSTSHRRGIR